MTLNFESWPFRPLQERSIEESAIWWENCYLPNMIENLIVDEPHWWILAGGSGTGKSVAIAALAQQEAGRSFLVPYSPIRWPGSPQAWLPASNHLAQMMANVSIAFRHYTSQHSEKLLSLKPSQQEFIRWLLERAGGQRAYRTWVDTLPEEIADVFNKIPQDDLYPSTIDPLDVNGQINELVNLLHAFGLQRVVFTVDLNSREVFKEEIADLFGWLTIMHHPGFIVVATVPLSILAQRDMIKRARGRVHVHYLTWTHNQCRDIADRHIQTALGKSQATLKDYLDQVTLAEMACVIEEAYGEPAPAGWVDLAETTLYLVQHEALNHNPLQAVKTHFFSRHMLLQIDTDAHGVWRGPRFIRLDEQPLELLKLLYRRRGHPINWDDDDLRRLAGSKNNVHSIVSRTRKAIEPIPASPIYIINKRGEGGYWLENYDE